MISKLARRSVMSLLLSLLAAACGTGTATTAGMTTAAPSGSGANGGTGGVCLRTGQACLGNAACCEPTATCAVDAQGTQLCCVPDGAAPGGSGGPADCCSQNGLDGSGNCAPGGSNSSASAGTRGTATTSGNAGNGSAGSGSTGSLSATIGTGSIAGNGSSTGANGSGPGGTGSLSAGSGSPSAGSSSTSAGNNSTTGSALAGNSSSGAHGSTTVGSGSASAGNTSGGTRSSTSGGNGSGPAGSNGSAGNGGSTGGSCVGQQTCVATQVSFCCNTFADCELNAQKQTMCCVPDSFPPDNADASACCSGNGLDGSGNCQPSASGSTGNTSGSGTGGGTGGVTGGSGSTGGGQCTGQPTCDPTNPNAGCCDPAAQCLTNSSGAAVCCVPDTVAPSNGDASKCCSSNGLDSSGACAAQACVSKNADCSGGATCCDNTLSCSIEPDGRRLCCVPDGTLTANANDCCSQGGLDQGDGGACAPNPDAGAGICVADQVPCFSSQTCCTPSETCQTIQARVICCVPYGGKSSSNGKDCCFSPSVNDGGLCEQTGPHVFPLYPNQGGVPVVTSPNLVTIEYPGFDAQFDVAAWGDWIVSSPWLTQVGADYKVGAGTHQNITLPGTPSSSVSDADIQNLINGMLGTTLPAWAANNLYMIFFPSSVTVTANGSSSCNDFYGYHYSFLSGNHLVLYAVVDACTAATNIKTEVQSAGSHELMEAVTDPNPTSATYANWQTGPTAWNMYNEIGDACNGYNDPYGSFYAQRIWSNSAAKTNDRSPCIPVPASESYFTAYANYGDGGPFAVVPASTSPQTITFSVTGWTTGTVADYRVISNTVNFTGSVSASLNPNLFNNGVQGTLQVNLPPSAGAGAPLTSGDIISIELDSVAPNGTNYNQWAVGVKIQ